MNSSRLNNVNNLVRLDWAACYVFPLQGHVDFQFVNLAELRIEQTLSNKQVVSGSLKIAIGFSM